MIRACLVLRSERLRLAKAPASAEDRTLHTALQGIAIVRRMRQHREHLPRCCEVSSLRIGSVALAAVPGELYNALGSQLCASSPHPLIIICYANGYVGYLPSADAYAQPDYEVLASPFAPGTAERLTDCVRSQLLSLFPERRESPL
jgi:hypothetical protein